MHDTNAKYKTYIHHPGIFFFGMVTPPRKIIVRNFKSPSRIMFFISMLLNKPKGDKYRKFLIRNNGVKG